MSKKDLQTLQCKEKQEENNKQKTRMKNKKVQQWSSNPNWQGEQKSETVVKRKPATEKP